MKEEEILKEYTALKQLKFEKIKHRHNALIKNFQTDNKELKDFLIQDAERNQEMCVNTTFLIFDSRDIRRNKHKSSNLCLLGYVTITNDSIDLNGELKEKFRQNGINYKALPALKIGRLCVDKRFEERKIGSYILNECIKRACFLNKGSACRFVTLDAKRHKDREKDSLHFYKRWGFNVLEHKDKSKDELIRQTSGSTPMYLDIYHITKKMMSTID